MTKTFVKKPFLTLVAVVIVLTIGIVSLTKMNTDLMPEMELPYMMVIVTDPGASPSEVEKDIVEPLESALGTINGVENVVSSSNNSYGYVMLEFGSDTDMDSALVRVSQAANTVELPDNASTPNLMEVSMDMMATMYANVDYDGKDVQKLTDYVNKEVIPELSRQEGVASVSVGGAVEQSVEVRLNQDKIDEVNKDILTHTNKKLSDAQDKIDKGLRKLQDGEDELSKQQDSLENKQDETYDQLATGQVKLAQAQATKTAYEATLNGLKASRSALQAEKKAYEDAKLPQTYEQLDGMFANFQATMGDAAKASGIEIPSDVEDAVKNPDKFKKFKAWLTGLGYGDQIKDLSAKSLKQVYQAVKVRMPQIETELGNLKTEIMAAKMIIQTMNKQMAGMDDQQAQVIAGGYAAAAGFGSGTAQMASAKDQMKTARQSLKDAQKQLDDSRDAALDHANLDALLTLDTLSGLVYAQNFSMPAGYIDDKDDDQWLVQIGDNYKDVDELKDMVLTKVKGVGTIKLSDVADVTMVNTAGDNFCKVNGKDALMLSVFKSSTASTSAVAKRIQSTFRDLEKKNDGLSFTIMMNQGDYISTIIQSVLSSILLGAALAIIVLALFLRDVRPTLVVAFSIPFSVLFAIVAMYFTGIGINVMSLAGLCIGIGMLVDNSIVVMENIYRLRGLGYSGPKAAVYGAKQVAGPIIASTITTICVFLPMVYTSGTISDMLMPFSFTISYALIASLLVALTVVPTMGSVMLKSSKAPKEGRIFGAVKRGYARVLAFCLRRKFIPLLIAVALLAVFTARAFSTGMSMMDDMESNQITGSIQLEDGVDKDTAFATAQEAMEDMMKVDGVDKVSVMDGSSGMMSAIMGSSASSMKNYSTFTVNIITKDTVKTTKEYQRIIKDLQNAVKDVDAKEITIASSAMGSMGSMMSTGMQVDIYGPDSDRLVEISEDVMDMLKEYKGLSEISNGMEDADNELHLKIDRDKAAKKGLTVAQIFQQVAGKITTEKDAITMSIDDTDTDVKIVNENDVLTCDNILDASITATVTGEDGTQTEKEYKHRDFASIEKGKSASSISRRNQENYVSVTAEADDDTNVTLLSRKLQTKLDAYDPGEGYSIEIAGETEQVNDMLKQMLLAIALGLLLVYLVMVAQFQSLLSPFIILFTIPLAFTGGMIGLGLFHQNISSMSLMGFMILMGTVVNNGIVFVDYANQLRLKGVEKHQALLLTGMTRMRPIIMTALTTILSMSVMVFSNDAGNAMQKGMAIVVCFGLIYATFMTLFIVPVLYDIFYRKKEMHSVDVGSELEDIPDETAELLAQYGMGNER